MQHVNAGKPALSFASGREYAARENECSTLPDSTGGSRLGKKRTFSRSICKSGKDMDRFYVPWASHCSQMHLTRLWPASPRQESKGMPLSLLDGTGFEKHAISRMAKGERLQLPMCIEGRIAVIPSRPLRNPQCPAARQSQQNRSCGRLQHAGKPLRRKDDISSRHSIALRDHEPDAFSSEMMPS